MSARVLRIGCYPGSFDPPTIAHLAIAEAAREQCALDHVDLVLSTVVLGKEDRRDRLHERIAAVEACIRPHAPGLRVAVTAHQLLADVAEGYGVLVLGADKWEQIHELRWYGGSADARDAAIARLPPVAIVARPPHPSVAPSDRIRILELPADREWHHVSSTAVRNGAEHLRAVANDDAPSTKPTTTPSTAREKPHGQQQQR